MASLPDEAKSIAVAICRAIDEDEAYIAGSQFERLLSSGKKSVTLTDEGQFEIPSDAVTYASLVVPFIGGLFADAIKDLAKEKLVALLKRWFSGPPLSSAELGPLKDQIDATIDKSKMKPDQRTKLKEAIANAFR